VVAVVVLLMAHLTRRSIPARVAQAAVALVRFTRMVSPQGLPVRVAKVTQVLVVIAAVATLTLKPVVVGVVLAQRVQPVYIAAVTAVTDLQVQSLAPR
jgi:hypothetical protein